MSKKTFMAAIVILTLLFLVAGMFVFNAAEANPIPSWLNGTITIQSPQNQTTSALPVFVNFTSQSNLKWSASQLDNSMFYVLDGQSMSKEGIRFTGIQYSEKDQYGDYNIKSGQAYLYGLADGVHNITVYYGTTFGGPIAPPEEVIYYTPAFSATVQFYVDSTMTPTPIPSPTSSPTPTVSPTATPSAFPETPSPTPLPTPLIPNPFVTPPNSIGTPSEYPALIIVGLVVVVMAVAVLFYFRRR